MHNVTTSRHIRGSSELMIMVPIKNEFVPITELVMTYASRISVVLQALAEIRQLKIERGFGDPIGPIERLQTIYRVQWTVIEPFDDVTTSKSAVTRQTHGPQVVLTSHFDSSWEHYFQQLVTTGGPLLDLIFSHCQDYEGFSCKDGFDAFASFIRRHQRRCDFLYCTAPEVTIDDIRYVTRYSSAAPQRVQSMEAEALATVRRELHELHELHESKKLDGHDDRTRSALRVIQGLRDIRERLFLATGGLGYGATHRTDQQLFDAAVASTLIREPELYRLSKVLEKVGGATAPELLKAAAWITGIVAKDRFDPTQDPPTPLQAATTALAKPATPALCTNEIEELLADVQGNILNGYPKPASAKLVLLRCHDRGGLQRVLSWARVKFTSELDGRRDSTLVRTNLGVTHHGLKLLDLPQGVLESFPREYREGMEERAGLIGDVGHNHPWNWKLPRHPDSDERAHLSTVHVALVLQGTQDAIAVLVSELKTVNAQGEIISTLDLSPSGEEDHSQPLPRPELRRDPKAAASALDYRALGEFILGYENQAGEVADCAVPARNPTGWSNLFKNGSFMAMRKMQKNEAAFDSYVADIVQKQILHDEAVSTDLMKALQADVTALIVGRRSDGRMFGSLDVSGATGKNDFDFSKDANGDHCPLDSHVRRSNPRHHGSPRIARRSLPYGPEADGAEQGEAGLLFMACCGSLANQYEIVQRWVNGGNSTGLVSRQNDLLFGAPIDKDVRRVVSVAGTCAANLPNAPKTIELKAPAAPFVTLRWGLYLFMPSLTALYRLCDYAPQSQPELERAAIERGQARIAELNALPPALRTHEWKRLLEEVAEADSPQALHARDVAAAITRAGGALHFRGTDTTSTSAREIDMVVVTKADVANKVLSTSEEFSVKEYRVRLKRALDDHYLGYDKSSFDEATGLTYEQFSTTANAVFGKLSGRAAGDARNITMRLLKDPGTLELDPDGKGTDAQPRSSVAIRELALAVIGQLCHDWLHMPAAVDPTGVERDQTRGLMNAVERLLIASRYCFQFMPVPYLAEKAGENQPLILAGYKPLDLTSSPLVQSVVGQLGASQLPQQSMSAGPPTNHTDNVARLSITVLLGAVGFAPTAVAAVTRILDYWIESEQLWQIQRRWRTHRRSLLPEILEALSKVPSPPTLYRTATAQATALGNLQKVPENTLVIVNLAAVYDDAVKSGGPVPEAWFFGGEHGGAHGRTPQHGCPGRRAGLIVIEEILKAVLERKNLRRERRGLLSYDRGAV